MTTDDENVSAKPEQKPAEKPQEAPKAPISPDHMKGGVMPIKRG